MRGGVCSLLRHSRESGNPAWLTRLVHAEQVPAIEDAITREKAIRNATGRGRSSWSKASARSGTTCSRWSTP